MPSATPTLRPDRETSIFCSWSSPFSLLVDVDSEITPIAVGKIDGDRLEVRVDEKVFGNHYGKYVDKEGKTLFDRYKIEFNPRQDPADYQLKKYDP